MTIADPIFAIVNRKAAARQCRPALRTTIASAKALQRIRFPLAVSAASE
jgi:hypothetical protein